MPRHPSCLLILGLAACAAGHAQTRLATDVPATHWARAAVDRLVARGVLDTADGRFQGEKFVSRYQVAQILDRTFDASHRDATPSPEDSAATREALAPLTEDQVALARRVDDLGNHEEALEDEIRSLKWGGSRPDRGRSLRFSGVAAFALVVPDDGATNVPTGFTATPARTRYTGTSSDVFFAVPRMSMGLVGTPEGGPKIHLQLDIDTTRPDFGPTLAGRNVGVNEVHATWELGRDQALKVGGFAPSITDWEVDGPMRTSTRTPSPSAFTSLFESLRLVGAEYDHDRGRLRARLAVFTGADAVATGAAPRPFGPISDALTLQRLSRSTSVDDDFGFLLDVEGPPESSALRYRLGWFDNGGDTSSTGTAGTATTEIRGPHVGLRWQGARCEALFQFADLDVESAGAAGSLDAQAWYLLLRRQLTGRDGMTVRYDSWENQPSPGFGGTKGRAYTVAWDRRYSETSHLQVEWIHPDEDGSGAVVDNDDDQLQARWTVTF